MFKTQQNELPYGKSVTATETVFTKWTLVCRFFLKNCYTELHENPTDCLRADVM
jgi:hypothetical protein